MSLYAFVVLDNERTVQSVNRSVEGAAAFALSWGEPKLPSGQVFTTEAVNALLLEQPQLRLLYENGTHLVIEAHGIFS